MEGKRKFALNILALMLFIGLIIYLSIRYIPQVKDLLASRDQLKMYVDQQGARAIATFVGVQVFQVVVAPVPARIVQVAGGYLFGTFWGVVFLTIGLLVGSLIAFFASRLLGSRLVKIFISDAKRERILKLMSSDKSQLVIFLLYLLPGLPKDTMTYIAGLTPINPWQFLVISILGRLPALLVSCYIGASLEQENFWPVVIVAALSVILFFGGLLFKDRILEKARQLKGKEEGR
jgi:uncharacterized membrane protein YdjX (TVP38/TMEM64 family)